MIGILRDMMWNSVFIWKIQTGEVENTNNYHTYIFIGCFSTSSSRILQKFLSEFSRKSSWIQLIKLHFFTIWFLQLNLEKIENLEDKIKTEMETLKTKLSTIEEELRVISNLDKLRSDAAEKRLDTVQDFLYKLGMKVHIIKEERTGGTLISMICTLHVI